MASQEPKKVIDSTSALARHLGLSRWTISRVLNGHPEVKPETARRVREAMEELGFVPNPLARALRGGRSGTVGVCFQALGTPIVIQKISVFQQILRRRRFRALIELTDGNPELELEVIRHFVSVRVEGIVLVGGLSPANGSQVMTLTNTNNIPVVLVDPLAAMDLPTVELDRERGMYLAMEHLLTLGHRNFALLGIDQKVMYGDTRRTGIKHAAKNFDLSWKDQFTVLAEEKVTHLDYDYGRRLADRYLALKDRPTAIIALNDQVAIGAKSRLQEAGIRVPQEVSMVGFDNLEVSAHINPRLTTVDQQVSGLMEEAVNLLLTQIDSHKSGPPSRLLVEPKLVVRESTAVPMRKKRTSAA